ncbi:glycosyltransferase family 1 protein [uncultured Algibacter sp.]|uniref:glycosyltransferase family 4 protein n=1 Tax=uncultured Algibacter sp. TaxID=298659 RepID=UPI0032170C4E
MHNIFLETHNINNLYTGFGQFNLQLLKAIKDINDPELKFTAHTNLKTITEGKIDSFFNKKLYLGLRRYNFARIRKRYDLWHSLNQNTKIEPYHNIPYVLTVHDVNFIEEISSDMNHKVNVNFINKLNRAHAITYISEFAKASTHKNFKVPKDIPEYIIHNGNPARDLLDLTNVSTPVDTSKPYLFGIGNFLKRKNFHLLVEMLEHLPDFNLVIAGDNTRNYANFVKERIEHLSLKNRVTLTGKISEKEKQFYLKNCTAFVFPSSSEGFGLPIVEAMKFGVPILLANKSSLPEIGGEHAFYWNDLNPEKMAEKVIESLATYNNNKTFYQKHYIERANTFTWEKAAKQYISVYKTVIKNAK